MNELVKEKKTTLFSSIFFSKKKTSQFLLNNFNEYYTTHGDTKKRIDYKIVVLESHLITHKHP